MNAIALFRRGLSQARNPKIFGFLALGSIVTGAIGLALLYLANLIITHDVSPYALFAFFYKYFQGVESFSFLELVVYGGAAFCSQILGIFFIVAFSDLVLQAISLRPVVWQESLKRAFERLPFVLLISCVLGVFVGGVYALLMLFGLPVYLISYALTVGALLFVFCPFIIVQEQPTIPVLFVRNFELLKRHAISVLGIIGICWLFTIGIGLLLILMALMIYGIALGLQYLFDIVVIMDQHSPLMLAISIVASVVVVFLRLYFYTAFVIALAYVYANKDV